jgi:UDP-N-acetylmuramate dehydrogenase
LTIQENISLKPFNTFGIDVAAKYFARFDTVDTLQQILQSPAIKGYPLLILGGGSNILLTANFEGVVLKNEIEGIALTKEDDDHVYLKVGAGVNWHEFVLYCLAHDYAGVENLALIPGSVGASPMQNIGAYGVEIKDVFHSLEAVNRQDLNTVVFYNEDCAFGYRESIFKNKCKDQFVITTVTYRLNKIPQYKTSYGAIQQALDGMGVSKLSIQDIAKAVMQIRNSKLPNPKEIGNAGSFFKNPEIPLADFETLQKTYPDIVGYPTTDYKVKVAAGWMIEKAGWKGYRENDAGCHSKQALVLVNHGNATGTAIFALSEKIIADVHQQFGIYLHREVNIY